MQNKTSTCYVRSMFWITGLSRSLSRGAKHYEHGGREYRRVMDGFFDWFIDFSRRHCDSPPHIQNEFVLMGDYWDEGEDKPLAAKLITNPYGTKEIFRFPSEPAFSRLRNGQGTPSDLFYKISEQMGGDFSDWFDSNSYNNRLSRFFYVIDSAEKVSKVNTEKLLNVYKEILRDYRPVPRFDAINTDRGVFDFYIRGPKDKYVNRDLIVPSSFDSIRSFHSTEASTWDDFLAKKNIGFDLSIVHGTYAGLSIHSDIVEKFNVEKPYSAYFMLISVLISDSLRNESANFSNELVVDLCTLSVCVLYFIKTPPDESYEPNQYTEKMRLWSLPLHILSFFFSINSDVIFDDLLKAHSSGDVLSRTRLEGETTNFEIDLGLEPESLREDLDEGTDEWSSNSGTKDQKEYKLEDVYDFCYEIGLSCDKLRWFRTSLRSGLNAEIKNAKEKHAHLNLNLGQDFHYSIFDRLLNSREKFSAKIFELTDRNIEVVGKCLSTVLSPLCSSSHSAIVKSTSHLPNEKFGTLSTSVSVTGVEHPFGKVKRTEAEKYIYEKFKKDPNFIEIENVTKK